MSDTTKIDAAAQIRDKQYADSRKLAARARLHQEYTIAEEPWFPWVARRFGLKAGDRVLDVGCGPPGDGASEAQLAAFRAAIDAAFARGNGVLEVKNESGVFVSRKAG